MQIILDEGGRLTISDDAHCPSRVGLNYSQLHSYLKDMNVQEIFTLAQVDGRTVAMADAAALTHPFWLSI